MKTALEAHADALKGVAIALSQTASHFMPDWTEIFHEVGQAEGGSGAARTVVRNALAREDIHPLGDVDDWRADLIETRLELPGEPWTCLSILVKRDGQVDVNYSYDPNWMDRFFDDFEAHRPF